MNELNLIFTVALAAAIIVIVLALVGIIIYQRWRIGDKNAALGRFINENSEMRKKMLHAGFVKTVLLLALLAGNATKAFAIDYVKYNTSTKAYETCSVENATRITSSTTKLGDENDPYVVRWYVVDANTTVCDRISVVGSSVNLILADGATLTAEKGISMESYDYNYYYNNPSRLHIYGQTGGTGALIATGDTQYAAIGGSGGGDIYIHGGNITATGNQWTAGIGGNINSGGCNVYFYGGTTHAKTIKTNDAGNAVAIGRGSSGGDGTNTFIDGLCVKVGSSNTPVNCDARVSSLNDAKEVTVEPCTNHNWVNNFCTYCGLQHHYTITYDGNGNDGGTAPEAEDITIGGNMTVTVKGNTGGMTRDGYFFAGWNTRPDGRGTSYKPGDTFVISSMVTLYARWKRYYPEAQVEDMFVDDDFQQGEVGRYFVRMPGDEVRKDVYDENNEDWREVTVFEYEESPKTVNIPEDFTTPFKVYDSGGKNDNYSSTDVDDGSVLILNCAEGKIFRVQGNMETEEGWDYISIYDGNSTSSSPILNYVSGYRNMDFVTSGNSITFYLEQDGTESYYGLDVTVSIITPPQNITLANDDSGFEESAKNASVISDNNDKMLNVTLDGCTLYKDGSWNTICLPFDIVGIETTPLKDATVKTLTSSAYSDGTLTMSFSDNLTALEAGKPYIVKWADLPTTYKATAGTGSTYKYLFDEEDVWKLGDWYEDGLSDDNFCEFNLNEPMRTTGYTFETYEGERPTKWTLKGKLNAADDWTLLDSRDATVNAGDLPPADGTKTYNIAEPGLYQYFRLDVTETEGYLSMSGMWLEGTIVPRDIANPTFKAVTIKNTTANVSTDHADFIGSYSPFSASSVLFDSHNPDGDAMHGALNVDDPTGDNYTLGGWFTDAELTTPVTTIPFADDGSVTLYAKIVEVTAAVASVGWATLYTPYALNFSDVSGLTAYTATCTESTVTLTEVDDVPANTGVVLKGRAGSYTIPVAASSSTERGHLIGSASNETVWNAYDGYTLYALFAVNDDANVQFNPVTSGSIAAGKAFLKIADGTPARNLSVVFADKSSGIDDIAAGQQDGSCYDLRGQRVSQPSKGLYIVNGKKCFKKEITTK